MVLFVISISPVLNSSRADHNLQTLHVIVTCPGFRHLDFSYFELENSSIRQKPRCDV